MVPLRDINPVRITPIVNYLLIAGNVAAFLYMNSLPAWYETGYALVPTRIAADPLGEAFTIFTSMFMHANLMHIAGNLWFLWIFGDNVEDAMGHLRYLFFYLFGGVAAAVVQMAMTAGSPIPMVGASGAIAAVTGAYMLLYPRAPILVLNPVPLLWLFWGLTFVVPAWFVTKTTLRPSGLTSGLRARSPVVHRSRVPSRPVCDVVPGAWWCKSSKV